MPLKAGVATSYFSRNADDRKNNSFAVSNLTNSTSRFLIRPWGAGPFPVSAFMANFRMADNRVAISSNRVANWIRQISSSSVRRHAIC
jgi:hypothetical protein